MSQNQLNNREGNAFVPVPILSWNPLTNGSLIFDFQQQIHAQQVPGGPPQPIGALNPFGALGATMGLPHGPQGLLKAPPDHHRPDIKPTGLEGPAGAEERLVSVSILIEIWMKNSDIQYLFSFSAIRFHQRIGRSIVRALHWTLRMIRSVEKMKSCKWVF